VAQLSVEFCPAVMVTGFASNRRICGLPEPGAPTVTVTVELIVPFGPVAARV